MTICVDFGSIAIARGLVFFAVAGVITVSVWDIILYFFEQKIKHSTFLESIVGTLSGLIGIVVSGYFFIYLKILG